MIRLQMADGSMLEGSYLAQAGMHFVHDKSVGLIGRVHGPIDPAEVLSATLVKTKEQVIEEIRERKVGEPVPGTLHRTRDGYEARLERLANACASADGFRRKMEIEAQFNIVADEIALARTKRNWMLAVARWRLHSNQEPDRLDMAGGDMTVAERLVRPRPQDFHPDPAERRKRVALPPHLASDPLSPPNMLRALRAAGFKARVSVLSEMTDDSVDLLVDFPAGKKAGRFLARGRRVEGRMAWSPAWAGGDTATAARRRLRAIHSDDYADFRKVLRLGLGGPARIAANEDPDPVLPRSPR